MMTAAAFFFHVDNHAAGDFAFAHFLENRRSFVQSTQLDFRYDQAFCAELEGFFQVFARTDQRADHFDAVQDQTRDGQVHRFGRQADGNDATARADAVHGGVERGGGYGGNNGCMCAAGFFLNHFGGVFFGGVND